jgi:hypothetical protein
MADRMIEAEPMWFQQEADCEQMASSTCREIGCTGAGSTFGCRRLRLNQHCQKFT